MLPGHCIHNAVCCRTALQLQSNVTDDLVGDLATLNYLRDMSLRGCTALTGAPDTRFARLTMLTQLRCLDISNCTGLKVLLCHSGFLCSCTALCGCLMRKKGIIYSKSLCVVKSPLLSTL